MRVQLANITSETALGQPRERTHRLTFNELVPAPENGVQAGAMGSMIVGTGVVQIITSRENAENYEIGGLYDVTLKPVA